MAGAAAVVSEVRGVCHRLQDTRRRGWLSGARREGGIRLPGVDGGSGTRLCACTSSSLSWLVSESALCQWGLTARPLPDFRGVIHRTWRLGPSLLLRLVVGDHLFCLFPSVQNFIRPSSSSPALYVMSGPESILVIGARWKTTDQIRMHDSPVGKPQRVRPTLSRIQTRFKLLFMCCRDNSPPLFSAQSQTASSSRSAFCPLPVVFCGGNFASGALLLHCWIATSLDSCNSLVSPTREHCA